MRAAGSFLVLLLLLQAGCSHQSSRAPTTPARAASASDELNQAERNEPPATEPGVPNAPPVLPPPTQPTPPANPPSQPPR